MADIAFLCIDTQSGRCTRYVPTRLAGLRLREAGIIDIVNYHPCKPIAVETIGALEQYREHGDLARH